jgi:hypothetical protein
VDGGVAENTPISHAIALAASEIYVLPTGHAYALERPPALDAPSTSRTPPSWSSVWNCTLGPSSTAAAASAGRSQAGATQRPAG